MANIYNDGQGNYFMDAVSFANHSIDFDTVNYFKCIPHTEISLSITQLCTAAGLNFRDVLEQAEFDSMVTDFEVPKLFLYFGAAGDIDDRYTFGGTVGKGTQGGISPLNTCPVALYNASGSASTDNDYDNTNVLVELGNESLDPWNSSQDVRYVPMDADEPSADRSNIYWTGHATSKSLALFAYQRWFNFPSNVIKYAFWYAGEPVFTNVNGGGYYSNNIENRAILLATSSKTAANIATDEIDRTNDHRTVNSRHYIALQDKRTLRTGRAEFALNCQAGTGTPPNPPRKWSTGCFLFDDDSLKGDPAYCRVGNLIMGEDDGVDRYIIGRPENIQSAQFPEGYNNPNVKWMPVGQLADKTIMMMVWSP